jgi:hypothetical protein
MWTNRQMDKQTDITNVYIHIAHTAVFNILLIVVHSQTQHIIVDEPLYRRHVSTLCTQDTNIHST